MTSHLAPTTGSSSGSSMSFLHRTRNTSNLVPRAHGSFGQHQDTEVLTKRRVGTGNEIVIEDNSQSHCAVCHPDQQYHRSPTKAWKFCLVILDVWIIDVFLIFGFVGIKCNKRGRWWSWWIQSFGSFQSDGKTLVIPLQGEILDSDKTTCSS